MSACHWTPRHCRRVVRGLESGIIAAVAVALIGCGAGQQASLVQDRSAVAALEDFCLQAQALIANTRQPFQVRHYQDIEGFARAKAMIDPPTVKQHIWYEDEAGTQPAMVSCKMKSADHVNLRYPEVSAGPDGLCQDMNRATFARVHARLRPALSDEVKVRFDADEDIIREGASFSAGPAWLHPFSQATRDAEGVLVIHTKGFRVDFLDAQFADRPEAFRGIQYCHFIAPQYLERLLTGASAPGARFGIVVAPRTAPGD